MDEVNVPKINFLFNTFDVIVQPSYVAVCKMPTDNGPTNGQVYNFNEWIIVVKDNYVEPIKVTYGRWELDQ